MRILGSGDGVNGKNQVQGGFIMAEVLLAVMILATTLLAAAGMFIQATESNNSAAGYTAAANLAQKQVEFLKRKPPRYWADLSLPANLAWQDSSEMLPVTIQGTPYYAATTAAVSIEDANLIEVVIVVSWTLQGQAYTIQVTSFYAKLE